MNKNIIFLALLIFCAACSEETPSAKSQPVSPASTEVETSDFAEDDDGYTSVSAYELDYALLTIKSDIIDENDGLINLAWSHAYNCEYANNVDSLSESELESMASEFMRESLSSGGATDKFKLKQLISVKLDENDMGVIQRLRNKSIMGSQEKRDCRTTKRFPVQHIIKFGKIRDDLSFELPEGIKGRIRDGARTIDVATVIKYRVEDAEYRFNERYKAYSINYRVAVEALEIFARESDIPTGKPYKVFYESDLYNF